MANSAFSIFVTLLVAVSTSVHGASRFRRDTQVSSSTNSSGQQATITIINQGLSLPNASPSDVKALKAVQQVLQNPNATTSDIQNAIASAYSKTVTPLDAPQKVDTAVQGLQGVGKGLQGNLSPVAMGLRTQILQTVAFIQENRQALISRLETTGTDTGNGIQGLVTGLEGTLSTVSPPTTPAIPTVTVPTAEVQESLSIRVGQ